MSMRHAQSGGNARHSDNQELLGNGGVRLAAHDEIAVGPTDAKRSLHGHVDECGVAGIERMIRDSTFDERPLRLVKQPQANSQRLAPTPDPGRADVRA
jgi:hypothetical protein